MDASIPTRIVVGISGSQASRRAVEAGAREADSHDCPLHLVRAFDRSPGNADESRQLLQQAVAVAPVIRQNASVETVASA
jgi:nucleotide-binding universal stress UspA family protein